ILIAARLMPLGLVAQPDGSVTLPDKSSGQFGGRSPLMITLRIGFVSARVIEPIARLLQILFTPVILVPVLLAFVACNVWLYAVHGIGQSIQAVLDQPLLLFVISAFVLISAVFHEFGHASALRYGGGRARGIGFGLYLMYPAFYTDCTDSYRLSRWAR